MKCPVCRTNSFAKTTVVADLSAEKCSSCNGLWIARKDYDFWRQHASPDSTSPTVPLEVQLPEDPPRPKFCPTCGVFLFPYRVGHGLAVSLDFCGTCGGVWFDKGEWEAVRLKNLHHHLHEIVSTSWQKDIRQAAVTKAVEASYAKTLGTAYCKAREIKEWLTTQQKKDLILTYLKDPTVA